MAEHYISKGNMFAVLCLATAKKTTSVLPSWVPDWNQETDHQRCAMHTDALDTLVLHSQKLFEDKEMEVDGAKMHFGTSHKLDLEAWIIPRCLEGDVHSPDACMQCKLLNPDAPAPPLGNKRWSRSLMERNYTMTDLRESSDYEALLDMRRNKAQLKWGTRIREQFEEVMHPYEVLCLLRDSPFAFVLKPCKNECEVNSQRALTFEYCFQVDEEGWASDWFVGVLGEETQEWISLV